MANNQHNVNAVKESKFDGGLLGLIGTGFLSFLAFLVSVVVGAIVLVAVFFFGKDLLGGVIKDENTYNLVLYVLYGVGGVFALLGVLHGLAAMSTVSLRWTVRHTEINGRRLKFDGKARQLMGNYIKWFFLTIITIGIYSLWLGIKQKQWEVKHTVFAEDASASVAVDNGYGTNVYVNYAQPQMPMQPQMPVQPQMPTCQQGQYCPQMVYGFPPVFPPVNPYGNQNNQQNGNY